MKRISRRAIVALTLTLTGFGAANAKEESAVDKCIAKFVSSELAGFQGEIKVRKEGADIYPLPLQLRQYRVAVTAVDPATGTILATGTCKAGRDKLTVSFVTRTTIPAAVAKSESLDAAGADAG